MANFFDNWPIVGKKKPTFDSGKVEFTYAIANPSDVSVKVMDEFPMFDADFLGSLGVREKNSYVISKIITDLRSRSDDRKKRMEELRTASKDSIIGSALELMSDDATQFSVERNQTVWIISDNKPFAETINTMILKFIEPFIDSVAFNVLALGEFVFKIYKNEKSEITKKKAGSKPADSEEYPIILIPYKKVENIHHLILKDQSHWFVEVESTDKIKELKPEDFKPDTEFLHIINYSLDNSQEIKVTIKPENPTEKEKEEIIFVLEGEALLTEKALENWRILKALENGIIAARLAKSKFVRFVKVNVGRVDNDKAANIVNYINGLIATNEAMSTSGYESSIVQAEPVTVVLPVKMEVGDVNVEEFGTSVDIKEIVDIEYFLNKLFAALRTPKLYLGFEEAVPGLGTAAASLTRIDLRYCRAVWKVQRVLIQGIREFVRIYGELMEEDTPDYVVHIKKAYSSEDAQRFEDIENQGNFAIAFMEQLIDPDTGAPNVSKIDMLIRFFTDVTPERTMVTFLTDIKSKKAIKVDPTSPSIESKSGATQRPNFGRG